VNARDGEGFEHRGHAGGRRLRGVDEGHASPLHFSTLAKSSASGPDKKVVYSERSDGRVFARHLAVHPEGGQRATQSGRDAARGANGGALH
jgi:hypothetical protein